MQIVFSALGKLTQNFQEVDADLIPPLELCIRTRYNFYLVFFFFFFLKMQHNVHSNW